MTVQNLISASISAATKARILKRIADIQGDLDFLLTLQPKEIHSLYKAGNSLVPFLEKAYQTAKDHPEILPGVFDTKEFQKDYELSKDLGAIADQVRQLTNGIQNTLLAANSDALTGALEVYSAVKQNRDKVPGLNVVAEEMAVFFKKSHKPTNATDISET